MTMRMIPTKTTIALSTILLAIIPQAHAGNADSQGAGLSSCAEFTRFYRQNPTVADGLYSAWMSGFLTGLNLMSEGKGDGYRDVGPNSVPSQMKWMRRYCSQHPS
jgi:hypothetical protein